MSRFFKLTYDGQGRIVGSIPTTTPAMAHIYHVQKVPFTTQYQWACCCGSGGISRSDTEEEAYKKWKRHAGIKESNRKAL